VRPAVLVVVAACGGSTPPAHYQASTFSRGDEHFYLPEPGPWQRLDTAGGDLAWRDPSSRAVIMANATCRGHHDPPLEVLVNDLLIGTTERRVLLSEMVPLDGREARHEVVALKLDGVPLVYDLYVLKKDGCVYDLALVAAPTSYNTVADRFVTVVAGFRALGSGRNE
jgi:hypothetical protein